MLLLSVGCLDLMKSHGVCCMSGFGLAWQLLTSHSNARNGCKLGVRSYLSPEYGLSWNLSLQAPPKCAKMVLHVFPLKKCGVPISISPPMEPAI